ncbi:MAG: TetR/AcrR family transcriptional regulator [Bacteroidota bacterium]
MKESTQRKKEEARQRKRRHILDAAEHIILQEGLSDFSMDAVSKKAEIAKGTLYLYFKSKEDIIAQLTNKARESLLELFIQEAGKQPDVLDQIRAILWGNFHFNKKKPIYNDLVAFYEANRELENTEALKVTGQKIHNFVLSILQEARRQKVIKPELDLATFSLTMWGMSVGIMQLTQTKAELIEGFTGKKEEEFYHSYVEIVVNGIKA